MSTPAPAHARKPRPVRRAASAGASRPELRVVAPATSRAGRGVFTLVVIAVLAVGLLALLVVNTTLAQGAFTVTSLQRKQAELARQEQVLQRSVADAAAPAALQRQAEKLGMVPARTPAFVRLSDGKVLGDPKPAIRPYVPARKAPKPAAAATPAGATAAAGAVAAAKPAAASPSTAAAVPTGDGAFPADVTAAEAGDPGPSPAPQGDAAVPADVVAPAPDAAPATPGAGKPAAAKPSAARPAGAKPSGAKPSAASDAARPAPKPTAKPTAASDAAQPAARTGVASDAATPATTGAAR